MFNLGTLPSQPAPVLLKYLFSHGGDFMFFVWFDFRFQHNNIETPRPIIEVTTFRRGHLELISQRGCVKWTVLPVKEAVATVRIGHHPQPVMRELAPTRDVAPSRGWFLDQFSSTKAESAYYNINPHKTAWFIYKVFSEEEHPWKMKIIWRPSAELDFLAVDSYN